MAVKQVSNGGISLQGGSGSLVQPAASLPITTYNPQQTYTAQQLQPTVDGSINQSGSGLYTMDTGSTTDQTPVYQAPVDPYAKWGGYENYSRILNEYNSTKNLTYGSITDAINDTVTGTKSSILDFLTNYEQQQKDIDKQGVRSELGRESKRLGILDMIGQGLRNGQVTLNNNNASNSSAAGEIAKAYGRMGQKQMVAANTGYNLEQSDIADAQDALGINVSTFKRKYGEDKQTATNKIVQNAVAALSSLDQQVASSGVGDDIDVEAEKNRIRNEALSALGALDTVFDEGVAKVKPADRMTNRAEAFKLMNSGYVPQNDLGFETTLPIYTLGA